MKTIKIDLGNELQSIRIVPLSDMHMGEKHLNIKKLKEAVKFIEENDDVFTIVNGDNIDNAIKTSVGDIYEARKQPMEQVEDLIELLTPIKHKILAIIGGNHESRTYKLTGIDITKHIAFRLGIEERYSSANYLLFISFGLPFATRPNRRYTYSLFGTHGLGAGGRTVGGKLNGLERLIGNVDADIYLHGHTHLPATFKQDFIRVDSRTKTTRQVTKLFLNANSWLNYGGYGEVFNFRPSTVDKMVIRLKPTNGELVATCEV